MGCASCLRGTDQQLDWPHFIYFHTFLRFIATSSISVSKPVSLYVTKSVTNGRELNSARASSCIENLDRLRMELGKRGKEQTISYCYSNLGSLAALSIVFVRINICRKSTFNTLFKEDSPEERHSAPPRETKKFF
jgi:hypothetical protein